MMTKDEGIESFYYQALQHDAFLMLNHADSLKGLFKGKSLSELASNSLTLRNELIEVSDKLINDLYLIECERISLNMQISICHTISRRATEGEKQLQQAQSIYQHRVNK